MKQVNIILTTLLLSLVGILSGCSKEKGVNGGDTPSSTNTAYNVTFGLSVGAETYSVPAEDYEKHVGSVQALLFDSNNLFHSTPSLNSAGANQYGFNLTVGSYKMLVVANHTFTTGELSGKTLDQVGKMLIAQTEPGTRNQFVMASSLQNFTVAASGTNLNTINLTRLAARIDIEVNEQDKPAIEKLVLNKVTVKNAKSQSTLLASQNTNNHTKVDKVVTNFSEFGTASPNTSKGQFYTFENGVAGSDETNGIRLEIEASYNGAQLKPIKVQLPAVFRNYIYTVRLRLHDKDGVTPTPEDPKNQITFDLEVKDWNTGAMLNITAEQLLEIINASTPTAGVSYTFTGVTSSPDLSQGVSHEGLPSVQLTPTAIKQATIGGNPDPTKLASIISGKENFSYEVVNAGQNPWLTVTSQGVVTIAKNKDTQTRQGAIKVTVTEDTNTKKTVYLVEINQEGAPVNKPYVLASVNPSTLSFIKAGGSKQLDIIGQYNELSGNQIISSRALTLSDLSIQVEGNASWVTINGNIVLVEKNPTLLSRTAKINITVQNAPDENLTVEIVQSGSDIPNNPLSYLNFYNVGPDSKNKTHSIPTKEKNNFSSYVSHYGTRDDLMKSLNGNNSSLLIPTQSEWRGIVSRGFDFSMREQRKGIVVNSVTVAGKTFNSLEDFSGRTHIINGLNNGNSINCVVALRFKGASPEERPYKSAWLYWFGPNEQGINGLHIYCLNIAEESSITSVDHLNEIWWNTYISSAVYRFLPAISDDPKYSNSSGKYWTADTRPVNQFDTIGWPFMCFGEGRVYYHHDLRTATGRDYCCTRLISKTPLD